MKNKVLKLNINGREVFVNKMTENGLGEFEIDGVVFSFTIDYIYEEHTSNNGDGDFTWKTKQTVISKFLYYIDYEKDNYTREYLPSDIGEQLVEIANKIYYNVEEI